jgi:hypothetical protein
VADIEPQGLTDREILRSVEETLLRVLLPSLRADAGWARAVAIQLAGLARYAVQRPADATAERVEEITARLSELAGNEIVSEVWSGGTSQRVVMEAAGTALAAAVGREDDAADEVRRRLRPVLIRQLDDELGATSMLVDAFRGQLDG